MGPQVRVGGFCVMSADLFWWCFFAIHVSVSRLHPSPCIRDITPPVVYMVGFTLVQLAMRHYLLTACLAICGVLLMAVTIFVGWVSQMWYLVVHCCDSNLSLAACSCCRDLPPFSSISSVASALNSAGPAAAVSFALARYHA